MGLPSAYYNDSHKKWQKTCRALVDELLMPEGGEWEKAGDVPSKLFLYSTRAPLDQGQDQNRKLTNYSGSLPEICDSQLSSP